MQKKYSKTNLKIFFTGGHARSTAYSIIEEIKSRHKGWIIYWVGNKNILVGKNVQSMESDMFPRIGVSFLPIISGRIQRKFTCWTILELLKIPVGFLHAFYYFFKYKPDILVSMGGYTGFPLVVISRLLKIPVLIHEQTSVAGRANIYSSKFANKIALSRVDSMKYFDSSKCLVTGNPISLEVRQIKPKINIFKNPVILITGGASGSQKINDAVKEVLTDVLQRFSVVHQTGGYQFNEFVKLKKMLPKNLINKYQIFSTIYPWDWSSYLNGADIVVSRAGANIVSELIFAKKPAILIPLSIAYLDEQTKNANSAKDFGIATVLTERNLSGKNLLNKILEMNKNLVDIKENTSQKISPDTNAHEKVVDLIEKLLNER